MAAMFRTGGDGSAPSGRREVLPPASTMTARVWWMAALSNGSVSAAAACAVYVPDVRTMYIPFDHKCSAVSAAYRTRRALDSASERVEETGT